MLKNGLLFQWRQRRQWTQKQAAKMLGVSPASWCRYESGKQPVPKTLETFIDYIDAQELGTDSGAEIV